VSADALGPLDIIRLEDIEAMVRAARSSPRIRPSTCRCGKHSVYWVYAHPENREAAIEFLSQDKQHREFVRHIRECGIKDASNGAAIPVES